MSLWLRKEVQTVSRETELTVLDDRCRMIDESSAGKQAFGFPGVVTFPRLFGVLKRL